MRDMDLFGDLWCLDLGHDPDDPDGDIADFDFVDYQIWWKLSAYAGWPDDPDRRQCEIATFYALIQSVIESGPPDGSPITDDLRPICTALWRCVNHSFRSAGGLQALTPLLLGPPLSQPDSVGLYEAGIILAVIRSISEIYKDVRGPGSINKAIHVLDRTRKQYGWRCETDLRAKSWKKYKSVAHIGFAFYAAEQLGPRLLLSEDYWPSGLSESQRESADLLNLLVIAKDYQQFAATQNILKPRELWRIPDSIALPDARPAMLTLPEDMLCALRDYRAPT